MKKDLIIFVLNIAIGVGIAGIIMNTFSCFSDEIEGIEKTVVVSFSPLTLVENVKSEISSVKTGVSDQDNNTASKEAEETMNRITGEDSDPYSEITETPSDIAELMKEAEKTIEDEEVKGKTSEEDYQGGGTILSFGNLKVQSKIPDSFYSLDIESLLEQKADLSLSDISQPTILVYHSHTTESYTLLDVGYYTESADPRSDDVSKNMVRVGDELYEYLEKFGFNVIHDREIHDTDYNSAYDSSRKAVEEYLEEYPSIEITIDVHRDDITYSNGTKVKPTVEINGKKAARMMIISGCEYGRVTNFPDWEYNLRFNLAVQNKVNEMYEGLMRPILFSERQYNMDETKNSFLLEVGTDANTLDEACYSARLFATALAELLLEEYVEES